MEAVRLQAFSPPARHSSARTISGALRSDRRAKFTVMESRGDRRSAAAEYNGIEGTATERAGRASPPRRGGWEKQWLHESEYRTL